MIRNQIARKVESRNKPNVRSMKIKIFLITIFFAGQSAFLIAQNNTSSPYSGFGIGQLEMASGGRNTAMGQTGIGLRSNLFLNTENPASLTAIEPQNFLFDIGFHFNYTQLSNATKTVDVTNGNLSWLQMGFPISKKIFAGLSLNPKSSVGYNIYTTHTIEGTATSYPAIYEGSGGLSEAAAMLAWKLTRNISLGAKGGYLWGNVTQTLSQTLDVASASYDISQVDQVHYSGAYLNSGVQLNIPVSAKSAFVIGAIAGISSNLNTSTSTTITKTNGSTSEEFASDAKTYSSMKLPLDLGFGISYQHGPEFLATADYRQSHWEDATLYVHSFSLTTNRSYRAGIELAPKNDPQFLKQVKRYRFGYRYETGYLILYNTQIHEQAFSLGIGVPIKKDRSYANFSLEMGMRGTRAAHLVEERFIKLNCSLNLWDRWFIKRKYD